MEQQEEPLQPSVIEMIRSFAPSAEITEINGDQYIKSLWPFTSLIASIPTISDEVIDLLSDIKLSTYLWGIEHSKGNKIELILPIMSVMNSDFEYNVIFNTFEGDINLKTDDPSPALRTICRLFEPQCISEDGFIESFGDVWTSWWSFINKELQQKTSKANKYKLRSAYLQFPKSINIEDSDIIQKIKRMNFALRYANSNSANIVIEVPKSKDDNETWKDTENLVITGKRTTLRVSPYNIQLVEQFMSAEAENVKRYKYIQYYNILEYLFSWATEDDVIRKISQRVVEPTLFTDIMGLSRELYEIVYPITKINNDKLRASKLLSRIFLKDDMEKLIKSRHEDFIKPTRFAGGYSTSPLRSLSQNLFEEVSREIVEIRNSLVHFGSECIRYTPDNETALDLWVWLIRKIAQQAILQFPSPA